jgi:hypothetical protein
MRRPATRRDRRQPRRLVVVDSSAVVAILFGEPSAGSLIARLAAHPERLMSVAKATLNNYRFPLTALA